MTERGGVAVDRGPEIADRIHDTERRERLRTARNPNRAFDYVVSLQGKLGVGALGGEVMLGLRYVPDREIVLDPDMDDYLAAVSDQPWSSIEEFAAAVLADLNNQLVPRWVSVVVTLWRPRGSAEHTVIVEDRQPNWDNRALLARIAPA